MPKVRVTMLQEPIDVPEDEIPVLRAQGLLVEDEPDDRAAAKAPDPPVPAKPPQPAAE